LTALEKPWVTLTTIHCVQRKIQHGVAIDEKVHSGQVQSIQSYCGQWRTSRRVGGLGQRENITTYFPRCKFAYLLTFRRELNNFMLEWWCGLRFSCLLMDMCSQRKCRETSLEYDKTLTWIIKP
jgi:hypothetical protein